MLGRFSFQSAKGQRQLSPSPPPQPATSAADDGRWVAAAPASAAPPAAVAAAPAAPPADGASGSGSGSGASAAGDVHALPPRPPAGPGRGTCLVHLYVMHVAEELDAWPEAGERTRAWVPLAAAGDSCRYPWMREALRAWIALRGWPLASADADGGSGGGGG
jgi:hypothetical protein